MLHVFPCTRINTTPSPSTKETQIENLQLEKTVKNIFVSCIYLFLNSYLLGRKLKKAAFIGRLF
tara:strand:+ start:957 stop:1148 length:192 start_codon:yes stop_codon:yes gene_type:complete